MKLPIVTLLVTVYLALRARHARVLLPMIRCVAGSLLLVACNGAMAAPDATGTYSLDRCASFEGATAMLEPHCDDGYMTTEAHCDGADVDGTSETQIYRASSDGGRTWSCNAKWSLKTRGGWLCAHFVCAVRPPEVAVDAGGDAATVNVSISCTEPDGAPTPCFSRHE